MYAYRIVNPKVVRNIWPSISKWVEASLLDDVTLCSEDMEDICSTGKAELWLIHERDILTGCFIGWVVENPGGNYYFASILGGEGADKWAKDAYETLKVHAKKRNCIQLDMVGRLAWQKMFGIKPKGAYYSVNL